MKAISVVLFLVMVCVVLSWAQQTGTPIPPGVREADKIESRYPLEPPMEKATRNITPAELDREAARLGQLTSLVQQQVAEVNQGQLPRDLPKNLKEIEKLAHRLRSQLSR